MHYKVPFAMYLLNAGYNATHVSKILMEDPVKIRKWKARHFKQRWDLSIENMEKMILMTQTVVPEAIDSLDKLSAFELNLENGEATGKEQFNFRLVKEKNEAETKQLLKNVLGKEYSDSDLDSIMGNVKEPELSFNEQQVKEWEDKINSISNKEELEKVSRDWKRNIGSAFLGTVKEEQGITAKLKVKAESILKKTDIASHGLRKGMFVKSVKTGYFYELDKLFDKTLTLVTGEKIVHSGVWKKEEILDPKSKATWVIAVSRDYKTKVVMGSKSSKLAYDDKWFAKFPDTMIKEQIKKSTLDEAIKEAVRITKERDKKTKQEIKDLKKTPAQKTKDPDKKVITEADMWNYVDKVVAKVFDNMEWAGTKNKVELRMKALEVHQGINDPRTRNVEKAYNSAKHLEKTYDEWFSNKDKDPKESLTNQNKKAIETSLKDIFDGTTYEWRLNNKEVEVWVGTKESSFRARRNFYTKNLIETGIHRGLKDHVRVHQAKITDISKKTWSNAYHGTSHTPENRGLSDMVEYVQHLNKVYDDIYSKIQSADFKLFTQAYKQYKDQYKARYEELLSRHTGLVSSFIAGGSNFPAKRMNKKSEMYDRKVSEFSDWSSKGIDRIKYSLGLKKSKAGIRSDDPEAIQKLEKKLEKMQDRQKLMKAVNRVVRAKGNDEAKIKKIMELGKFKNKNTAVQILKPDSLGRKGFPSYELQNNNSNMKRVKDRISELKSHKDDKSSSKKMGSVEIIDNVEKNRLQLVFPDKPNEEVRKMLKSNGFRWSPKQGVWQSSRKDIYHDRAKKIIEKYQEK